MKRILSVAYRSLPAVFTRAILYLVSAKFIHGVVGIFSDQRGHVLVLRHVYRKGFSWGFPSGLLEAGEEVRPGALRELHEETGLDATVDRVDETVLVARRHLETVVYGTAQSDTPLSLSHEIFEARWVDPGNLPDDISRGLPPDQHRLMMPLSNDKR